MPRIPHWKPPANMARALAEGDGVWEDERWSPFLLTALSGTEHHGHLIPVAWQIEFDPSDDEFEAANASLTELGIEPDGYGWGEYILGLLQEIDPKLAERVHTTDCETATCVLWVESEEDCRVLLTLAWKLVFAR